MVNNFLKLTAFVASCVFCGYGACFAARQDEGQLECISANSMAFTARNFICIEGKLQEIKSIKKATPEGVRGKRRFCIPYNVEKIETCAFEECWARAQVVFEADSRINTIGSGAFRVCRISNKLQAICIPWNVEKIERNTFSECFSLKRVTFEEDSALEDIGNFAFFCCKSLDAIEIPPQVNRIGDSAFSLCKRLTFLTFLGDEMQKIGQLAFYQCNFRQFSIPKNVKEIGRGAFSECHKLESIEFLANVEESDSDSSFDSADEGIKKIANALFRECSSLRSIDIPSSVKEVDVCAFGSCSKLRKLVLPDSLQIADEDGFFDGWNLLDYITITKSDIRIIEDDLDYLNMFVKCVPQDCKATFERDGKTYVFSDGEWQEVV
jgi:hypothetical protein